MANPFEVATVNPIQALLQGQAAYDSSNKRYAAEQKQQALQSATQKWQAGDKQGALQTLLGGGNFDAATAFGAVDQRDYSRGRDTTLDARHTEERAQDVGFRDRSLKLQESANARANEDKPLFKEVTDANGATSIFRIMKDGSASRVDTGAQSTAATNPFSYGKQNEGQSKDSGYANRLFSAEQTLRDPKVSEAGMSLYQTGKNGVPVAGQYMTSPEYQKYDQAGRNFINAVLRRESGAAISQSEFDNAYKQYLPRPGDSKERLAEKQKNRQDTIASIAGGGGQNYRPPFTFGASGELVDTGAGKQGGAKPAAKMDPATAINAARDAIQRGADPNAVRQRLQQNGIDPSGL